MKHISKESKRSEEAVKHYVSQAARQTEIAVITHIETTVRGVEKNELNAHAGAMRDQLLRSLKFDRMNERRNQVTPSHSKTCSWMLRDGSEVDGPSTLTDTLEDVPKERGSSPDKLLNSSYCACSWDSFSNWLRSTEKVYWISGKPGSGKSTLVKYLIDNPQTQDYLELWRPNPIIISHFLWRPGTVMQQSIKGLLCSLLHQLLLQDLSAVEQVLRNHDSIRQKDMETDWSVEELQNLLEKVVCRYGRPIAIFLDGLDEVLPKDGVLGLLDVIGKLQKLSESTGNVKICLASRSEPLLVKSLGRHSKLYLEQLNENDIRQYTRDHIHIPIDYSDLIPVGLDANRASAMKKRGLLSVDELRDLLIDSLVTKAEGVFLWVYLTVTTVTKALREDESIADLRLRIDNLPGELADLFVDMWERANNDGVHFKKRAASYFQLALAETNYPLTTFVMMVATNHEMADRILDPSPSQQVSVESVVEACERTRQEVLSQCAGLLVYRETSGLEIPSYELPPWYGKEHERLAPYANWEFKYSFLHRTAQDFLTGTVTGKTILDCGRYTGNVAYERFLIGRLASHQLFRTEYRSDHLFGRNPPSDDLADILQEITRWIREEHDPTRIVLTRLLGLCKQVFDHGVLFGLVSAPPNSIPSNQVSQLEKSCIPYESTVDPHHEFIVKAVAYFTEEGFHLHPILPFLMIQDLDCSILSQVLGYACSFRLPNSSTEADIENRLTSIQFLLNRGASCTSTEPHVIRYHPILHKDFTASSTPLKSLMMSICDATLQFQLPRDCCRKLCQLVSLLYMHGAEMQQDVQIFFELIGDHIILRSSRDILTLGPACGHMAEEKTFRRTGTISHMVLVMAYPASNMLAIILQIWFSTVGYQMERLLGFENTINEGYGQGRLVALVELPPVSPINFTPPIFLSEKIYLQNPEGDPDGDVLSFVRFVEGALQVSSGQGKWSESGCGGIRYNVSIPSDVQSGMSRAIERMESANVPVKERQREFRRSLGIQEPLEEPKWLYNTP